MEWFSQNWVWVLFFAGFIAMHMFGHGGHGHGRRGSASGGGPGPATNNGDQPSSGNPTQGTGHPH